MTNVIEFTRAASRRDRFDAIIEPHFEALYGAARRMTLSPYDAEDLVQEVCVKAFARLDDLEHVDYPRAWLLKIMYNLFVGGRRQEDLPGVIQTRNSQTGTRPIPATGSAATTRACEAPSRSESAG